MHAITLFFLIASVLATEPVVQVLNGSYAGIHLPEYHQDIFLGIPYAQDTGGKNRFRVPQPLEESWDGVRPATNYSHACPDYQPEDTVHGMSENCLSINVVRPTGLESDARFPVLLWIHGGSYQLGTSGLPGYNLTYIVAKSIEIGKPIVAASINYRKGGWGNMYSIEIQGSGNTNLALRDMRQALSWIQENIASFNGDPNHVTIWGESSGAFSVGQLLMAYGGRTDGLFHQTIQQSGSAASVWYNGSDWYQPIYQKVVDQVNCTDAADTLECLRTVPYETLFPFLNYFEIPGPGWYPVVDGDFIPEFPTIAFGEGRFAHVPSIIGTNSDEGTTSVAGIVNTDAELRYYLLHATGFQFPNSTISRIMELYPDDPRLGVPINTEDERFPERGDQFKRLAAIVGDVYYHGPRRQDAQHYSLYAPTYVYRFNTRPYDPTTGDLMPAYLGVHHAGEIGFVFNDPMAVGPWPEYKALSDRMGEMWINFVNYGDPSGDGMLRWPVYNESKDGLSLVLQTDEQGGIYVEDDTYRKDGIEYLTAWARRRRV